MTGKQSKFCWVIGALFLLSGLAFLVPAIVKGDGNWALALGMGNLTLGLCLLIAANAGRRAARGRDATTVPTDRGA